MPNGALSRPKLQKESSPARALLAALRIFVRRERQLRTGSLVSASRTRLCPRDLREGEKVRACLQAHEEVACYLYRCFLSHY